MFGAFKARTEHGGQRAAGDLFSGVNDPLLPLSTLRCHMQEWVRWCSSALFAADEAKHHLPNKVCVNLF